MERHSALLLARPWRFQRGSVERHGRSMEGATDLPWSVMECAMESLWRLHAPHGGSMEGLWRVLGAPRTLHAPSMDPPQTLRGTRD